MASFSSYLASLSSASLGSLIFLAIAVLFPSKIASYEKKLVETFCKTSLLKNKKFKIIAYLLTADLTFESFNPHAK